MKIQGRLDFTEPFAVTVFVDEKKLFHQYSCTVVNHSPTGFQWGYSGSGPAQLALALLLLVTDKETAQRLHQKFKSEFIETLLKDRPFDVEIDLEDWVRDEGGVIEKGNANKSFEGKDDSKGCTFPDRCQKAEHTFCDCACGGTNHGVQVKMFT